MGIFLRLFTRPSNRPTIINQKEEEDLNKIFNNNEKNNIILNNAEDIKEEKKENQLCLKIYIVGKGEKKDYIINTLFKEEIKDSYLKTIADREFKTDQFHWIARIYNDENLTDEKCKVLEKEIGEDKGSKQNINKILRYQAILCFGDENVEILSENFEFLRKSRMIFITEEECDLDDDMDKRYASNIICKDITYEDLNIKIISALWELDCCFKEKGNQICRYTPEKIFKGLEKDNSMFSINILLTGLSRTGKSTFINLLSGKIMALEADETESVTKNISEYYIYRDDDKDEHGALKIIDTPGIVPNQEQNDKDYKEVENKVINMIKEQDKTFENKIHFIFFVLRKGAINLQGNNIKELFKALDDSKCPVYFIINESPNNEENNNKKKDDNNNRKDNKKKEKKKKDKNELIFKPIIENINRLGFINLTNINNFIAANFKKENSLEVHGINIIFKKMYEHIDKEKYLDDNLKNKMFELMKDFLSNIQNKNNFGCFENEDIIDTKNCKIEINFNEKMNEIKELTNKNYLFSKINVSSIIENGKKMAEKCKDIIISFSNLKGILPNISHNIPGISILQAFMVKEIAESYGLDINILNSGTKFLLNSIYKNLKLNQDKDVQAESNPEEKENKQKILNIRELSNSLETIENKIKDKLEKGNNKKTILALANLLNLIKKENGKYKENSKNKYLFNINFTKEVYKYCIYYFEKELEESKGLIFMVNYFNKCESLLKDMEFYINKKEWENYDIEIKK